MNQRKLTTQFLTKQRDFEKDWTLKNTEVHTQLSLKFVCHQYKTEIKITELH